MNTTTINTSPLSLLRRTPRRKLFSSSEDDDSPLLMSFKSSKFNDKNNSTAFQITNIVETRPTLSSIENYPKIIKRQSKLEQFGFDMLPRSTTVLKRQLCKDNLKSITDSIVSNHRNTKLKRIRINNNNEYQQSTLSSCHLMKTRIHLSTDSHSDHLVKLFDKTLSTVTPVRDCTNEHNKINSQYRRGQPLPLILSDNIHEDDMPQLTLNDNDLSSSETKKRTIEHLLTTDENSSNRSLKRSKITHDDENKENTNLIPLSSSIRIRRGGLVRSLSEQQSNINEEQLKVSVELGSNHNLIGDRSRMYLLPRCRSRKHADLACISAETMIDLIRGKYSSDIEQLYVIDCRYPYEYDGGHISIAKNIFTRSQIQEEYFRLPIKTQDPTKRLVFVFHCEFSSERAPSLLRYMRSEDRNIHANNYPTLHYPELYLLEGGYKAFFEYSTEFCKPNFYRTMLDEKFQEQCRQFRSFSKQSEKITYLRDDISNISYGIQNNSRRTRTTLRTSLSLCFTSTSLTNEMDFS